MKIILIPKQEKKTKIIISERIVTNNIADKILIITGPLGELRYVFKNQYKDCNIFIKKKSLNFFVKNIQKLIKSVTSG